MMARIIGDKFANSIVFYLGLKLLTMRSPEPALAGRECEFDSSVSEKAPLCAPSLRR
jgi:hypothetical protein